MTRDEIYETLVDILAESFELEPEEIKPDSKLYEELGLDSIDAVDIFVQLREITGRRPDPAEARKVRTMDDLILFVEQELDAAEKGLPEPEVQRPSDLLKGDTATTGDEAPEKKAAVGGE